MLKCIAARRPLIKMALFVFGTLMPDALIAQRTDGTASTTTDLRTCPSALQVEGTPEPIAVRCAEDFVRRNGYTEAPVDLSSPLAFEAIESIEWTDSIPRLLAERHASLEGKAAGICAGDRGAPGYTVAFRRHTPTSAATGRAVTMSPQFTKLRMEHVDFILAAIAQRRLNCHPLS